MTQSDVASPPAIDLTQYAEQVNSAFYDGTPCVWATSDDQGNPDIALKGSSMVFDRDHLAFLERSHGTTVENLKKNPNVVMLYRNSPKKVGQRRFYGVAEVLESGAVRDQVRERSIPEEVSKDRDNRGIAVVVRVDRVVEGGKNVQQRS